MHACISITHPDSVVTFLPRNFRRCLLFLCEARFVEGDAKSSRPSSAGDGAGRKEHTLGAAAPTEDVADLPFLPEIRRKSSDVYTELGEETAGDDFKELKKVVARQLQPLKSLKTVIDDRLKAIIDRKKNRKPSNLSPTAMQVVANACSASVCVVVVV